ncbi:MAG: porin family protein [Bradyrhizobiaceae bacterium]|nr:MAG: porin family protein [Bradyrhizobiaceae bacterium]
MSKKALGAMAFAIASGVVSAQAADLPYGGGRQPYTVNQPLNMYSWAGPYLGGNIGYGWGDTSNNPTRPSGFNGGIQGGYNWQRGPWVFGIEADAQLNSADDTFAPWKFSNPWYGTVRGRAGYAVNNVLFYGTGGLAFGEVKGETFGLSEDHTALGWTVGLGAEFAVNPNWSVKAEYLYVDLSKQDFSITGTSNGYDFSVVRLGVNYHF